VLSQLGPLLYAVGQGAGITAIAVAACYLVRAVALLLAVIVAVSTDDPKRQQMCLDITRVLSRGWPQPPRLPGGSSAWVDAICAAALEWYQE
jgi:hypothetical protein